MRPRTYTVKFEIGCIVARKRGIGFLPADDQAGPSIDRRAA